MLTLLAVKTGSITGITMNYQTYIFDLDGTLLDSLTDLYLSCNVALKQHGLPERSYEEVRMFVGNGVKKLMERAVPADTSTEMFNRVYEDFRAHYLLHNLDHTQPYAGIPAMLQALKANGKQLAVVSNKFYAATQALVKHFFGDTISVAIGEREQIRKKPAPDTVEEALRQLGVSREGAVYVGDSDVDILTARNTHLPCISVLWGFRDKEFLLAKGATTLVARPEEILDI